MTKESIIQSVIEDSNRDDFVMVVDTNVLLQYCFKSLNEIFPDQEQPWLDSAYADMIDCLHKNGKISISYTIQREFRGVLMGKCNNDQDQYKRVIERLGRDYTGTIISDILDKNKRYPRRNQRDWRFNDVTELRDFIETNYPKKLAEHVKQKNSNRQQSNHLGFGIDDSEPSIFVGGDQEILAYCTYLAKAKNVLLYTNDSDFRTFKLEIEEKLNVRIFSNWVDPKYKPLKPAVQNIVQNTAQDTRRDTVKEPHKQDEIPFDPSIDLPSYSPLPSSNIFKELEFKPPRTDPSFHEFVYVPPETPKSKSSKYKSSKNLKQSKSKNTSNGKSSESKKSQTRQIQSRSYNDLPTKYLTKRESKRYPRTEQSTTHTQPEKQPTYEASAYNESVPRTPYKETQGSKESCSRPSLNYDGTDKIYTSHKGRNITIAVIAFLVIGYGFLWALDFYYENYVEIVETDMPNTSDVTSDYTTDTVTTLDVSSNDEENSPIIQPTYDTSCSLCWTGIVTGIDDGDTIFVDGKTVRLSLVSVPYERHGNDAATAHTTSTCPVGMRVLVDPNDVSPKDKFGRFMAKVTCGDTVLNESLYKADLAEIRNYSCKSSEFASESWADDCPQSRAEPSLQPFKSAAKPSQQIVIAPRSFDSSCAEYNRCYMPSTTNLKQGDTIQWVNQDSVVHTIRSGQVHAATVGQLWLHEIEPKGSVRITFGDEYKIGESYYYHCMLHPWMQGVLRVQR